MQEFEFDNLKILLGKEGVNKYSKLSYPVRYGRYNEIQASGYVYQFNLKGELKYMQGRGKDWPHGDWLKRTATGDWIYYTAGEYSNIYGYTGEYYLPCFSYLSNSIFPYKPFENKEVSSALASLDELQQRIAAVRQYSLPESVYNFLQKVMKNYIGSPDSPPDNLHDIIGTEITVLPPDARHADYDVIPVIIADGCLYNCAFCMVKSGRGIQVRSEEDIDRQIALLKNFYKDDICNYNSVFLGNHDSLYVDADLIEFAAARSYESFDFKHSYMKGANLFLFGSISSLLNAEETVFKKLNKSPYYTYVNIGLESADQASLDLLEKPVKEKEVEEALRKMTEVNREYENVEITANFLMSSKLPDTHYIAIETLIEQYADRNFLKGCIYFSPMNDGSNAKEMRKKFLRLKSGIRLPAYIYLIQRL